MVRRTLSSKLELVNAFSGVGEGDHGENANRSTPSGIVPFIILASLCWESVILKNKGVSAITSYHNPILQILKI